MKERRINVTSRGGGRRHGDPPAWLDETLPLEERRRLLTLAIHAAASSQQQAAIPPAVKSDGSDNP